LVQKQRLAAGADDCFDNGLTARILYVGHYDPCAFTPEYHCAGRTDFGRAIATLTCT